MADYPRSGIHPELEDEANRIIRESLKGVTARSAKSDILTPWKEQDRRSREVYNANGVADPSTRMGMFHRAWNPARPDLNSRDGVAGGMHRRTVTPESSLGSFVAANLRGEDRSGDSIPLSFGDPE